MVKQNCASILYVDMFLSITATSLLAVMSAAHSVSKTDDRAQHRHQVCEAQILLHTEHDNSCMRLDGLHQLQCR